MLVQFPNEQQLEPLTLLCNQGAGGVFSNVRENLTKGFQKFVEVKAHGRTAVICGSGPSLADTLESIRAIQKRGAFVIALNGAGKFLNEKGIRPDVIAMVDSRPENIGFVEDFVAPEAWIASQCHPSVAEQAEKSGMKVVLWHPGVPEIQNHIPSTDTIRMGGGYTIGLCSISCAYVAGYREIHLFGLDSSHRENKGHAFDQPLNADDETMIATVDSRQFTCSVTMAAQASLFLEFTKHLLKDGVELHVHGDGLLPTLWQLEMKKKGLRVLNAVYDLGVSPPTYDFISFMVEAERHRVKNNFDVIDLSFQPGPMHGFRADELPPDVTTRRGMLQRVCLGIARLLPSVRNIEVLQERRTVTGHIFPAEWKEDAPMSHYGTMYLRDAEPMLQASEYARKWAKRDYPYATITIRQANHWPQRNSNLLAWFEAAVWLKAQGIEPIFIPDAENELLTQGFQQSREAAYDVDLRAALYEGAEINLGVANGPMFLLPFLKAKYLIFNICVDGVHSSSKEFLLAHGLTKGDGFGGDGQTIWEADTAEVIIGALKQFEAKQLEASER